jgi:hypothetical protein
MTQPLFTVTRSCAWCKQLIPARARRDSITCSKSCRQARHRFMRSVGVAGSGLDVSCPARGEPSRSDCPLQVRRIAYADPPYPGKSHYYRDHPDYAGEVDHADLICRLQLEHDGWALSTSAAALPAVLRLCPDSVRVAAWHRGERPTRSRYPLSAWEPVIYVPARPLETSSGPDRRTDSLVHGVSAMLSLPGRVIGTKPAAFCRWLFGLLAALPGDEFVDLYPGSGAVWHAWQVYASGTDVVPRPVEVSLADGEV